MVLLREVSISIRNNTESQVLLSKRIVVDKGTTVVLDHHMPTEGLCGKYEVVLKVRDGFKVETMTRPIEILPSATPSPETLDITWLGAALLPEYGEEDWRGVVRSLHHLGMNTVIIPDEFHDMYEISGNRCLISDPVSVMMSEAENLQMNVIHEVVGPDDVKALMSIYGGSPSLYGFCVTDGDLIPCCRTHAPGKAVVLSLSGDRLSPTDMLPDAVITSNPSVDVCGSRLWLLVDEEDIDSIKQTLMKFTDVEKAVYYGYLGVMDNPSFHPIVDDQKSVRGYVLKDESNFGRSREVDGRKSMDLYVSYSAYSMFRDWMKPYSVPPGARLISDPKGVLKEDVNHSDYVEVCTDQFGNSRLGERHWQAVPSIAAESDGSVVYEVWNAGGRDEEMGNYLTVAISEDLGKTWKRDELVIYPTRPRESRIFDPVIWRSSDGSIRLKFSLTVSNTGIQLGPLTSSHEMTIRWNGETMEYTEPEFITYGLMINPPTDVAGRELYPIYRCTMNHLNRMIHKQNPERGTFAYVRKGRGGFRKYAEIPPTDYNLYDFDEHQFVCLDETGRNLMCVSRFRGGPRKSFSHDFGRTWSEFEPMPEVGPATSSRLFIMRLASGRLMLIYNNHEERRNMTIALSDDNGESWPHKLIIDARNETSYPAACQLDDGTIVMAYDRSRYKDMDIFFMRFTEEDILSGVVPEISRITDM